MKVAAAAFALTLAWMIGPLAHAVADDPGLDWMPREQIRQKIDWKRVTAKSPSSKPTMATGKARA